MRGVLTALVLAGGALAQSTWVVDAGGGGQFTQIQPAVDAAVAGDRIEVWSGDYAGFTVSEGLDIVATGPGVRIVGQSERVIVRAVPATQRLTLDGLLLGGIVGLELRGCDGAVVLRDLRIDAVYAIALQVEDCRAVYLIDCGLRMRGLAPFMSEAPCVWLTRSFVHFAGCSLTGGSWLGYWGPHYAVVECDGGEVVLSRCRVEGYPGSWAYLDYQCLCIRPPSPGQIGISGTGRVLVVDGSWIEGGIGGEHWNRQYPPSPASSAIRMRAGGEAVVADDTVLIGAPLLGTVTRVAAQPSLRVGSRAVVGGRVDVAVGFRPDGAASLFVDVATGPPVHVRCFEMPFLLTPAAVLIAVRPTDGRGVASFPLRMPAAPSLAGRDLFFQGIAGSAAPLEIAATPLGVTRLE